jgi:hypothetical protein
MDEQLKATLTTGSAYSSHPVVHNVRLVFDGKPQYLGSPVAPPVPTVEFATGQNPPVFYQNGPSSVAELVPSFKRTRPVLGASQIDGGTISAIAAQPGSGSQNSGSQLAVAVRAVNGCTVYVGGLGRHSPYHAYPLPGAGGSCTSLSWDVSGRIWAATARSIWVVQPGAQSVTARVPLPFIPGTRIANYKILALRMAPDAVRAALLIQQMPAKKPNADSTAPARSVLLAAVAKKGLPSLGAAVTAGTALPDLRAISWYNAYYLAALTGNTVYKVPLTGGASSQLGTTPIPAQTLATDNSELLVGATQVGSSEPEIIKSPVSALSWTLLVDGANPTYPG